jgi:hypothetical protein
MNTAADTMSQVARCLSPAGRGRPSDGVILYSYAGTGIDGTGRERMYDDAFYRALSRTADPGMTAPLAEPADHPRYAWKTSPSAGHVAGYVLKADSLEPVDGAFVSVTGRRARQRVRADCTGFFAVANLPPGVYRVRASSDADGPYCALRLRCVAGRTARCTALLGEGGGAVLDAPAEAMHRPPGKRIHIRRALVMGGTDTFPDELYVRAGARSGCLRVRLETPPIMALQPGDVVAIAGTTDEVDGEELLTGASARLVDIDVTQHQPARFVGTVTGVRGDRCIVTGPDPFELVLASQKAPDIDSPVAVVPPPPIGSRVVVTGVTVQARQPDGTSVLVVRPIGPAGLQVISGPIVSVVARCLLACLAVVSIGALWLSARRSTAVRAGSRPGRRTEDGEARPRF